MTGNKNGPTDSRATGRSNVFLTAIVYFSGGSTPVRVRNLSPNGALLEGDALPSEGETFELRRGGLSAHGTVAWHRERFRGVRFNDLLKVEDWVKKPGHSRQHDIDRAVASIRAGGPLQSAAAFEVEPIDLPKIVRDLEQICDRLASTRQMSVEFGEELVRLEAVTTSLRRIANRR